MAKPKNTEPMVDCGCYQTVSEPDGDCAVCPMCKEIAPVIYVCADGCGDDDGEHCECEENAKHEAECARMKSLYDAEVKYGIHIPEGTKPELMPDLDGFF
jgi:hypothetical protein